jgi:hypothetical protein
MEVARVKLTGNEGADDEAARRSAETPVGSDTFQPSNDARTAR